MVFRSDVKELIEMNEIENILLEMKVGHSLYLSLS